MKSAFMFYLFLYFIKKNNSKYPKAPGKAECSQMAQVK